MSYIGNHYDTNMIRIRIKEIRTLRGETQQSLADKIGVKRQAIINWEKKKESVIPTLQNLVDLCETLDCSMDYLLGSVDTPEFDSISKASHYSGIKPEIIRYGIEHLDFLDCLNFFMHPDNSARIFDTASLNAWKKFWVESSLEEINGELKEKIILYYDEYISINPFDSINITSYKQFLKSKFPKENISLSVNKDNNGINIKKCVSLVTYQSFFTNKEFNYSKFINYIAEYTFEPLSHRTMIELQKNKLANMFVDLFTKYLDEE